MMPAMLRWMAVGLLVLAPEPEGVIKGVVRDSVTGHLVTGVRLTLTGQTRFHTAMTDETGGFRFEKLPPGDYQLRTSKLGYAGSDYIGGRTERVSLKPGAVAERLTIDIPPTASIEGRVLGESGEPLPGVTVWARNRSSHSAIPATTDRHGKYRIEYLAPGNQELHIVAPLSVRRRTVTRDPETGELWGYVTSQYYPGVEHADLAAPVAAPAGACVPDFDIVLHRRPLVDLKGRAMDSVTREALRGAQVELYPDGIAVKDETYERRSLGPNGDFQFELVRPGQHRMLVYRGGAGDRLPYVTTVEAGPSGAPEIQILAPPPVGIEGRVIPPENNAENWGTLLINLDMQPRLDGFAPQEIRVQGNDGFRIDGVPPGSFGVRVNWSSGRPKDWYVAGIRFGSQDARKAPITVAGGANPPLEITLSDDGGRIAGRVVGGAPEIVPLLVVVHPVDLELLPLESAHARMEPDGSFSLAGLAPGEYGVSLPRISGDGATNRTCTTDRAKVTVERGETASVLLEPCGR